MVKTPSNIIFIHIPKAAGTSIVRALTKAKGLKIYYNNHKRLKEWVRDGFNEYVLTCCRDPFSRLYSVFRYLKGWCPGDYYSWRQVKEKVQLIEPYKTFSDFVDALKQRKIADTNLWKPQASFIKITNKHRPFHYSFLLRYESLERDWLAFSKELGIELPELELVNKSNIEVSPLKEVYTEQMADVVRELYKIDFKVFGYSMQLPN